MNHASRRLSWNSTCAVFGSTEPRLTGPRSPKNTVLRHQVECNPCFLSKCPWIFTACTPSLLKKLQMPFWSSSKDGVKFWRQKSVGIRPLDSTLRLVT